jgi:hypothetical protein
VTRKDEWENIEIRAPLGDLKCELEDFKGFQEIVLVRRVKNKKLAKLVKLKNLEDEGVMRDEAEPTKKKSQKKKEEKENQEYEEFIEDVLADDDMKKNLKIYKNKDALKHLSKE